MSKQINSCNHKSVTALDKFLMIDFVPKECIECGSKLTIDAKWRAFANVTLLVGVAFTIAFSILYKSYLIYLSLIPIYIVSRLVTISNAHIIKSEYSVQQSLLMMILFALFILFMLKIS